MLCTLMLSLWQLSITMALMGWRDAWPPAFSLHSYSTQTCKVLSCRRLTWKCYLITLHQYLPPVPALKLDVSFLFIFLLVRQTDRKGKLGKIIKKCSRAKKNIYLINFCSAVSFLFSAPEIWFCGKPAGWSLAPMGHYGCFGDVCLGGGTS